MPSRWMTAQQFRLELTAENNRPEIYLREIHPAITSFSKLTMVNHLFTIYEWGSPPVALRPVTNENGLRVQRESLEAGIASDKCGDQGQQERLRTQVAQIRGFVGWLGVGFNSWDGQNHEFSRASRLLLSYCDTAVNFGMVETAFPRQASIGQLNV